MTQSLNSKQSSCGHGSSYGRVPLPLSSASCHSTAGTRRSSSSSLLHPERQGSPSIASGKAAWSFWLSLNNLVVQAKPVPLGFNSSKTCSVQSFHNSLITSLGLWCFTCKIKMVATDVLTLIKNISQHSSSFLLCALNTCSTGNTFALLLEHPWTSHVNSMRFNRVKCQVLHLQIPVLV